jgi:hypothetical protein
MRQLKSWYAATAVSHKHHTLPLFESCYGSRPHENDTASTKHCSEKKSCKTFIIRYDDTAPQHCWELTIVWNFRYGSTSTIRLRNNVENFINIHFATFGLFFAFGAGTFGRKSFGQKYHSDMFRIRSNFVRRKRHSEIGRSEIGRSEIGRSEIGRSEIWQCTKNSTPPPHPFTAWQSYSVLLCTF